MQNSDWEQALAEAPFTEKEKHQHRVIIRWFLGYGRKRQPSAPPGRDLANEFDRELRRTRNPPAWQLNQWRAGLPWFLEFLGEKPAAQKPGSAASPSGNLTWRHRLIGQLRQKHVSYRAQNLVSGWQWSRETHSQPEGNESGVPGAPVRLKRGRESRMDASS